MSPYTFPILRHSTDIKRLPCVVTNKGSGKQPSYKLLTEFGILMPYPGSVKCGDPSVKISLAAVVRKVVSAKRIFCHCKGACTALACRYKKASIKCSSQCHGIFANDCRNRTSSTINKSDGSLVKEQEKVLFRSLVEKLFAMTKCISYKIPVQSTFGCSYSKLCSQF